MRKTLMLPFVLLLLGMAACNPVEKKKDTSGGNGGQDGDRGKPSVEIGPIKLGFNLELTGNAATFGISARKGAELAVDELNAAGGVLGRKIEAIFDDNASVSDQSAKVASKLIYQDKVHVLLGAVASSNSIAMAKIAEEAKVPMVTPASTNPSVTVNDDGSVRRYVFRTCFTDDFQGEGIADFAVNGPIGAKRAVIFYDADNDYSVGIRDTIKRVAPSKGLELVAEDSYLSSMETDYRTKLNRFKSKSFDVLIVPGYYNQVAMIANQARELGITQPLLGGDGFDSPDLWANAGKNIEGSYFTNHYASDDMDPAVQNYIRKFKERFGGNVPDAMSVLTYDAVNVVADAIRRAGSTDHEAVTDALSEVSGFKGAAGMITINETHDATKKLVVLEIGEGGKFSWVYTYDPLQSEAGEPEAEEEEASDVSPIGRAGLTVVTENEEIYDQPIKTQVVANLLIAGDITEAALRSLLESKFLEIKSRRNFKHHNPATNIYIYAFKDEEMFKTGGANWIAMLQYTVFLSTDHHIMMKDAQIAFLHAEPEERYGLSEATRKQIYEESWILGKVIDEVMAEYPDDLDKQLDYQEELIEKYEKELAAKYGITRDQFDEISIEGLKKGWLIPRY